VITELLKAGADINARDEEGRTALMIAAKYNKDPEVIAVLLKAGADARVKDNSGHTALDWSQGNAKLEGADVYQRLQAASR
jgi:ankyrin repeat protein